MEIKIIRSGDGSHTLFLPHLNETYHSHHGALTESLYVFIEKGLLHVSEKKQRIRILEIGLGTGLNALLTMLACREKGIEVSYHSLEPFPLGEEVYTNLNYPDLIPGASREDLLSIHKANWEKPVELHAGFSILKYRKKLEDFYGQQDFDLVYFDAFAPNKQPEVWHPENLRKCFALLVQEGVFVTYCAQGQFRRDLKGAGFRVENLPGPPGKKEMTRAFK